MEAIVVTVPVVVGILLSRFPIREAATKTKDALSSSMNEIIAVVKVVLVRN